MSEKDYLPSLNLNGSYTITRDNPEIDPLARQPTLNVVNVLSIKACSISEHGKDFAVLTEKI